MVILDLRCREQGHIAFQPRRLGARSGLNVDKALNVTHASEDAELVGRLGGVEGSESKWPGPYDGVPTVSSFFGIAIRMFFEDHGFPHFHAQHSDGKAKVRIDTLEVIESNLGRRQLRFVLAWAELHQDELAENWLRAKDHATLRQIEPLR
jgi:hypothetical protein